MSAKVRVLALSLAALLWGSLGASAGTIQVGGTGSALAVLGLLGEAFSKERPDIRVVVLPSLGSKGGLRALQAGRIDLAAIASDGTEVVAPLTSRPWGRSPFAVVVADATPIRTITADDLIEIYSGRRARWPDGTPIRPVLRPPVDSANATMRGIAPGMSAALDIAQGLWGAASAITDQDTADALETVPGAIGALSLGQIMAERRKLHPVALDGVAPSLANLSSGAYSHVVTYRLVSSDSAGEEIRAFLAYLASPVGRERAAALGYLTGEGR